MSGKIILHLGAGSFHRAHQAWYLYRLIESGDSRWSLNVGNIRNDMPTVMAALAAQNGLYTLETVTPRGERRYELIRAIARVLPWQPDLASLIEVGAAPDCKVISFTVTEGGYYLDEHDRLDVAHPDLAGDLDDGRRTIYGALTAVLDARRQADAGSVTLLSCDNLRNNGSRFRAGLLSFLELRRLHELRRWVEQNTACPNAMVDRITPRPGPDLARRVQAATGFEDRCPVMAESFIQWVIEDRFIADRPHWEAAGVEMVDSVLPYEEAKIRILNASHSGVAWAGTLRGLRYIHEGTSDETIRSLVRRYVIDDVIPCLRPSPLDLDNYREVIIERFSNANIHDSNQRVAADGFAKIPGFFAPTFHDVFASGRRPLASAVLVALFFRFLELWHRGTLPYDYQDSVMDAAAAHAIFTADDPLQAFCAERVLWGNLSAKSALNDVMREALRRVDEWYKAGPR